MTRDEILCAIDDAVSPAVFPDPADALEWLDELASDIEARSDGLRGDLKAREDGDQ